MAKTTKVIFVAFAIEDVRQRDLLKGQSLHTDSPFEYVDMSVKEAYETDWKAKVQTRIRRSDGVIALVSKNTLSSSGEKWEIKCALDEGKPLIGMWAYTDDRTRPAELAGKKIIEWTWDYIAGFIDGC
jgi:nucleoside 2-deoxyribosyltransferase